MIVKVSFGLDQFKLIGGQLITDLNLFLVKCCLYLIDNTVFVSVVCLFQMALKHHPDKNPNNPEATEKVSQILPHKLLVTAISYDDFKVSSGTC